MRAVQEAPSGDKPMGFTVLRVPFFLEPDYPEGAEFEDRGETLPEVEPRSETWYPFFF